jgi:hypothetical protein
LVAEKIKNYKENKETSKKHKVVECFNFGIRHKA